MGSRGAYDRASQSIPIERREYITIGSYKNIKIIEGITTTNGKTPVMSNSANTVYAVYSQDAGRIKHVFIYKNHILVKAIDLEGDKSHWHNVTINPQTGEIGRSPHAKLNSFEPTKGMWALIHALEKWKK